MSGPPHGAKNPESADPYKTLQIVGRPRKALPETDVDLGWATVLVRGRRVWIASEGEPVKGTTVGRPGIPEQKPSEEAVAAQLESVELEAEREPGTSGLELELEEEEPFLKPLTTPKTRVGLPKTKPRRKALTDWEHATTLKGFDPYTLDGL